MAMAAPLGSHWCSWRRIHCTRTGLPTSCDSKAASPDTSSEPLWPSQPDPSVQIKRTCEGFMPNMVAKLPRVRKDVCVADQTVALSARTSATAHEGPIEACS